MSTPLWRRLSEGERSRAKKIVFSLAGKSRDKTSGRPWSQLLKQHFPQWMFGMLEQYDCGGDKFKHRCLHKTSKADSHCPPHSHSYTIRVSKQRIISKKPKEWIIYIWNIHNSLNIYAIKQRGECFIILFFLPIYVSVIILASTTLSDNANKA